MKTLHTTNPRNVIAIHARIRLALAVVGIVTAVLCTMALLQDVSATGNLNRPSHFFARNR